MSPHWYLGVAYDGLYMIDPSGAETTMVLALRNFLQFGEWVITEGDGRLNPQVSETLFAGGNVERFAQA